MRGMARSNGMFTEVHSLHVKTYMVSIVVWRVRIVALQELDYCVLTNGMYICPLPSSVCLVLRPVATILPVATVLPVEPVYSNVGHVSCHVMSCRYAHLLPLSMVAVATSSIHTQRDIWNPVCGSDNRHTHMLVAPKCRIYAYVIYNILKSCVPDWICDPRILAGNESHKL